MRFGWVGYYHLHVTNTGSTFWPYLDYACRGGFASDNNPEHYTVFPASLLQECEALCVAAAVCKGFEFSLGRCEVWHREPYHLKRTEGVNCFQLRSARKEPTEPRI